MVVRRSLENKLLPRFGAILDQVILLLGGLEGMVGKFDGYVLMVDGSLDDARCGGQFNKVVDFQTRRLHLFYMLF